MSAFDNFKTMDIVGSQNKRQFSLENEKEEKEEKEVYEQFNNIKKNMHSGYWDLSRLLWLIFNRFYFKKWGYKNWAKFVKGELDYSIRTVGYFVSIWDYFGEKINDKRVSDKVSTLGWSLAKELIGIVTPDNIDLWMERIKKLSKNDLMTLIRQEKGLDDGDKPEKSNKLNFVLFDEQLENVNAALDLAGEISGSTKKGNQLDLICGQFRAQNVSAETTGLDFLESIEKSMDCNVIVISKDGNIVYGEKYYIEVMGIASNEKSV